MACVASQARGRERVRTHVGVDTGPGAFRGWPCYVRVQTNTALRHCTCGFPCPMLAPISGALGAPLSPGCISHRLLVSILSCLADARWCLQAFPLQNVAALVHIPPVVIPPAATVASKVCTPDSIAVGTCVSPSRLSLPTPVSVCVCVCVCVCMRVRV